MGELIKEHQYYEDGSKEELAKKAERHQQRVKKNWSRVVFWKARKANAAKRENQRCKMLPSGK